MKGRNVWGSRGSLRKADCLPRSWKKADFIAIHRKDGVSFPAANYPDDPCKLAPAWQAAVDLLESNRDKAVPVSEICEIWREQPFGIKDGLLPVLTAAFILSQRRDVAFYRQSIFQARVTDLDMDYLAKDLRDVQLRWMDLSETSRQLLSDMAGIVRALDENNTLPDLEPIDVAKGLVSIHDRLPPWVGRTQHLSSNAKRVRQLFKQASDPNSLISHIRRHTSIAIRWIQHRQ